MSKTFAYRSEQHDHNALPLVESIFRQYGFTSYTIGAETDNKELHDILRRQDDVTSVMLRFRPDRISVHPGLRSVLCEIKSEFSGYRNFAIEISSYEAALLWNRVSRNVMFVFVDLAQSTALAAWADDIPSPDVIYIPARPHYEEYLSMVKTKYPAAIIKVISWHSGSGTPYMLLPKDHPCLMDLGRFIETNLLNDSSPPTEVPLS